MSAWNESTNTVQLLTLTAIAGLFFVERNEGKVSGSFCENIATGNKWNDGDIMHEETSEAELKETSINNGISLNKNAERRTIDPYDNLSDEDEPTSCTICLINRQGPCRPVWRKFERCMKDNMPKDDGEGIEGSKDQSPSMSEKCDSYMIPWITCIQKFRNRYTLISNDFFQKEMIDEVESSIEEKNKVLLDGTEIASFLQVGSDWNDFDLSERREVDKDEDVTLVEGVARINLWDAKTSRPIEIAYVRDQNGTVLGYEQFFDFKKRIKDNQEIDRESGAVGICNFHVNPNSTLSLQIFALYREEDKKDTTKVENAVAKNGDNDGDHSLPEPKETLFFSKVISMDDVPIQIKEPSTEGSGQPFVQSEADASTSKETQEHV